MKSNQSAIIKFLMATIVSALLAYAIGIYGNLPWWSFVISNFIIAIAIDQKPLKAFISGALGVGLLWLTLALMIDQQNGHLLSTLGCTGCPGMV